MKKHIKLKRHKRPHDLITLFRVIKEKYIILFRIRFFIGELMGAEERRKGRRQRTLKRHKRPHDLTTFFRVIKEKHVSLFMNRFFIEGLMGAVER